MVLKGKHVTELGEWHEQPAGAFWFISSHGGTPDVVLGFQCPCGCGKPGALPLYREGEQPIQRPAWLWDGNKDAPTLTPSVQRTHVCNWHGFLQSGEWRS